MNVLALACLAICVRADDPSLKIVPRFQVENVDVRSALVDCFEMARTRATLSLQVKGKVTVDLTNVTWEALLQTILKQVNATYRVEGGRYEIVPRRFGGCDFDVPEYSVSDGKYKYILKWNRIYKVKATDELVRIKEVVLQRLHKPMVINLATKQGIRSLADLAGLADSDLLLHPEFKGIVEYRGGDLDHLSCFPSACREPSPFKQMPLVKLSDWLSVYGFELLTKNSPDSEDTLTQTANELIACVDRWQFRVQKSDLQIVEWSRRESF